MIFQNDRCGIHSPPADNTGDKRIDVGLEIFYLSTIDGQLGAGSVGIDLVAIAVKKLGDTLTHDVIPVTIRDLDDGRLQKIAYTVNQWVVINRVGKILVLQRQPGCHQHRVCAGQIGRAGESQHGVERCVLSPFVHHLAELDVAVGGMMHLVDENG